MDVERSLVSRCLDHVEHAGVVSAGIEYAVSRGLRYTHFEDPNGENAQVFNAMVQHMSNYNTPPSREAMQAQYPYYRWEIVQDAIDFIIDEFVRKVKRRETQKALIDIATRVDNRDEQLDLELVLFEAAELVSQVVPSSRVSRLSDAPSRMELLRRRSEAGVIPGVQLGWPTMDNETLGIQGSELVVFAAYSNAGKSTFLQYSALAGYLVEQSQRNRLFISLEMDGNTLLRKFDAMATSIQLHAVKAMEMGRGALSDDQMRTLDGWAERANKAPHDILIIDDINNCTVERVLAETMRYKPVATYIDYLQYMDGPGENTYTKVGYIAKGLKKVARLTGIPQITAAQTTRAAAREGVRDDNIADSIEIYRSADWMFGIERNEDMDAQGAALMRIVKARDGKKGLEARVGMDYRTMDFAERSGFGGRQNIGTPQAETQLQLPPPPAPVQNIFLPPQTEAQQVMQAMGGNMFLPADPEVLAAEKASGFVNPFA